MSKELTAEECFKSTELAKFKNKKSFRKETMFDFAEHYHEIKSKEDREELELTEEDLARWINKAADCAKDLIEAQARINQLEEKMKKAIDNGYTHWNEAVEDFEQTLK